ncbi:aromatic ring-hydroxylating oxygenase subunit alpha [Actinocrispum wychmicini]|uniref:Choline monooxygenase n=1 Tax=Actinocrispum wychmicini TaxID=1213861 RepID=A0A4R2J6L3_9PSEU|nr:aromatic ring-hydroxylating dioxygenase subunit alpha [Actinocrispum wychmicini]TCO54104.1 choline monooxygenase [Actinocrispum wychmicini]
MSDPYRLAGDFDPAVPIDAAGTPPKRWYVDPAAHDHEVSRVFTQNWLPVCRAAQVAEPGDYVAGTLVGNPYVVVRGTDGQLRAFHNVCSHHAAEVAVGAGRCEQLRCGYHGWTYRLDGVLSRVPGAGRLAGFDPVRLGLKAIPVASWGPLVFLRLAGPSGARDLSDDTHPLGDYLEPSYLAGLTWVTRREYVIRCNWKVFVENSLDGGYHVPYVHPRLSDGLAIAEYTTHVLPRTAVQICATNGDDVRLGKEVAYGWLYPNLFVNRYGAMVDTNIVLPLTHDTCVVVFDWFHDPLVAGADIDAAIAESDDVQQQDVRVCESVQRGMGSIGYDRGRYSPVFETAVHAFHKVLWEELR